MDEKLDKHLDNLIKKAIQHTELESPPENFITDIMSKIEDVNQITATVYKPLISKTVWTFIFIVFMSILFYTVFSSSSTEVSWLNYFDFSFVANNKLTNYIPKLTISNTLRNSFLFFGIVFLIQIPILKNYFDKRIAL
jgi:Fe2+ transport system protein B